MKFVCMYVCMYLFSTCLTVYYTIRFLEVSSESRVYFNIVHELQKNYNGSAIHFFYERMVAIMRGDNVNWTTP